MFEVEKFSMIFRCSGVQDIDDTLNALIERRSRILWYVFVEPIFYLGSDVSRLYVTCMRRRPVNNHSLAISTGTNGGDVVPGSITRRMIGEPSCLSPAPYLQIAMFKAALVTAYVSARASTELHQVPEKSRMVSA